jgi:uncharacterized membrane protein
MSTGKTLLALAFSALLLPYTMFYNWAYDTLRDRVIKRREQKRAIAS